MKKNIHDSKICLIKFRRYLITPQTLVFFLINRKRQRLGAFQLGTQLKIALYASGACVPAFTRLTQNRLQERAALIKF